MQILVMSRPQEMEARRVLSSWQSKLPRLYQIFDNCKDCAIVSAVASDHRQHAVVDHQPAGKLGS